MLFVVVGTVWFVLLSVCEIVIGWYMLFVVLVRCSDDDWFDGDYDLLVGCECVMG